MSRIRYVGGKIIKTSGGDTTLESLNDKFVSHARLSNNWSGEKGIIEKDYVNEGLGEWIIDSYWTDQNDKKITSAHFGDKVRYHLKTKNINDHVVLIQLLEWNTISNTKLLPKTQGIRIKDNHAYIEYLLDYEWVKHLYTIGEGGELEVRCNVFGWGRVSKMPAELKVRIGEIPQLILVNGHWNRLGELIQVSPGTGGKEYWSGFLGGLDTFISNAEAYYGITVKNKLPFCFDGSSLGGLTSGGKQRKKDGYSKAKELFSHLKTATNKQPICLVSHSEGGAYACGIAEYLDSIGYTIQENLLLHCDEADEFEVSTKIPTYQLNAMYFTKDATVLKKMANAGRLASHSQQIRKVEDHYAVVDWMVGDYKLKGVKKYGVMIVNQEKTGWTSIHTYLVNNNVFDWLYDLRQVRTYDVIGEYKGKAYAGKGQSTSYTENRKIININQRFYRIDNDYIIPNYPK